MFNCFVDNVWYSTIMLSPFCSFAKRTASVYVSYRILFLILSQILSKKKIESKKKKQNKTKNKQK